MTCCRSGSCGQMFGSRFVRRSLKRDRAGAWIQNTAFWLLRRSFRVFVHRPVGLTAAAARAGLEPGRSGRTAIWEYAVLRRAA